MKVLGSQMSKFIKKNILIISILIIGVIVRFLFFPFNVYFGFDQARDAFTALGICGGDFPLLGPSTSLPNLFHGVLYYYLITPFYCLSGGNPFVLAIFLKMVNALGIILIYISAKVIFQKNFNAKVIQLAAIFSAILFAFSFEQTQFSIYMGNPTPAVITILLFYLGLALIIFSKNWWGLPLTLVSLGLSIQFQFALFYLIIPTAIIILLFFRTFWKIPNRIKIISLVGFLFSTLSFIVAEFKFDFRTSKTLLGIQGTSTGNSLNEYSPLIILSSYWQTLKKMMELNISGPIPNPAILIVILLMIYIFSLIKFPKFRLSLGFLGIWFFSLFSAYLIGGGRSSGEALYYTNIGIAPALQIGLALLLTWIATKQKLVALLLLLIVVGCNLFLIWKFNPKGTITAINVQQGMLLSEQQAVLDTIYLDAKGEPFAAKGLTSPLLINTTWSYLYEWYGKDKYGYLPVWGDKNAAGYFGNLKVNDAQDSLPPLRYVVIEPTTGLSKNQIDDYLRIEGYFTDIAWEKRIGNFTIQKRVKK